MAGKYQKPNEEMTVDIELDGDIKVTCEVITIFTADGKDYIAVLPQNTNGRFPEDEVWIYRYSENPDDPNEEPGLEYIDDDEEYEIASDAFDEYLDSVEFDDMNSEDE